MTNDIFFIISFLSVKEFSTKASFDEIIAHDQIFLNGNSIRRHIPSFQEGQKRKKIKNRRQTAVSISASCPSKRLRG
jgi:hypothetical protein